MRHENDEAFNDLVYAAWRSGRDPDAVSRDAFDDRLAAGSYPEEITLDDVLPKPKSIADYAAETREP